MQRIFNTPLTPLQKVLMRLEAGGVICSHYEGKTRIYRFNPSFALLTELEQLLKKAYTLLPAHEKKLYCMGGETRNLRRNDHNTLLDFWEKLYTTQSLSFTSHSKLKETSGWNGRGSGNVTVTKPSAHVLVFNERGSWRRDDHSEMDFTNVYRWTLDKVAGVVSLEHLRHGMDNPVFLFHLSPTTKNSLSSVDAHLCGSDSYYANAHFDGHTIQLTWRVIGPKKNEKIEYCYL